MPDQLQKLGTGETTIGFLFALYPLVSSVTSFTITGRLIQSRGSVPVLTVGYVLLGGAAFGFAFARNSIRWLFIFRAIMGCGASFVQTSVFSLSLLWFQKSQQTTVVGINEGFSGLAFMVGPAVGGVLFHFGGFKLPFLVVGTITLLCVPMILCVVRKFAPASDNLTSSLSECGQNSDAAPLKTREVLNRTTVLVASMVGLNNMCWGSIDPNVSMFLQKSFNLGEDQVGFLIII
eukprot:942538_1